MKDFPLFRSVKAGLVGIGLLLLPLLICLLLPEMALSLVFGLMALMPVAICMAGLICGAFPMAVGVGSGIGTMFLAAGVQGAQLMALYLVPIAAAFLAIIVKRIPFWKGCAAMIGVHVAALAGCYLLLQQFTDWQLYTVVGDLVLRLFPQGEAGDALLYSFYEMKLLELPADLKATLVRPAEGALVLSEAVRNDLLLSLRALLNSLVVNLVPSFIATQSILGGVGCLLLPLRFGFIAAQRREIGEQNEGEEEKVDFPDLGMPPLSLWHIPRGVGWKVGVALIGGTMLQQSAVAPISLAGLILTAVAEAIFLFQGLAVMNFIQKAKGTARPWRVIVPLVLHVFSVLHLLGILDQITNMRGLRKPPEPKEE